MNTTEENMALKTTLCTMPLLAMMLHTGTKKNEMFEREKYLIDRCPVSIDCRKMIRMKHNV
jgi:hypothetical protein